MLSIPVLSNARSYLYILSFSCRVSLVVKEKFIDQCRSTYVVGLHTVIKCT